MTLLGGCFTNGIFFEATGIPTHPLCGSEELDATHQAVFVGVLSAGVKTGVIMVRTGPRNPRHFDTSWCQTSASHTSSSIAPCGTLLVARKKRFDTFCLRTVLYTPLTSRVIVNVASRLPAACLDARAYGAMSRAQSNINARTRIAPRTHSPVGVDLAPRAVSLGAEGPTARVESIINHRIRRQSLPRNRSHHHRTRRPPPRLRQSS